MNLRLELINLILVVRDQHLTFLDCALQILRLFLQLDLVVLLLIGLLLDQFQLIQEDLSLLGQLLTQLAYLIRLFSHTLLELSLKALVFLILELELILHVFKLGDIFVELLDLLLFHHNRVDGCFLYLLNIGHQLFVFMRKGHQIVLTGTIGSIGQSTIELNNLRTTFIEFLLLTIQLLEKPLPLRKHRLHHCIFELVLVFFCL